MNASTPLNESEIIEAGQRNGLQYIGKISYPETLSDQALLDSWNETSRKKNGCLYQVTYRKEGVSFVFHKPEVYSGPRVRKDYVNGEKLA